MDITRLPSDTWIVDFGGNLSENDAALFEAAFAYVTEHIKPGRITNNRPIRARYWWRHSEIMPAMRAALKPLERFIATPRVAKHGLFVWLSSFVLPDCQLVVITRADDAAFGVLHSRFHELLALRMGTSLEDRPRYTPTTTFETFPFPEGVLSDPDPDARFPATAEAAKTLNQLRENWLNPKEWVDWVTRSQAFGKRPSWQSKGAPDLRIERKKRFLDRRRAAGKVVRLTGKKRGKSYREWKKAKKSGSAG